MDLVEESKPSALNILHSNLLSVVTRTDATHVLLYSRKSEDPVSYDQQLSECYCNTGDHNVLFILRFFLFSVLNLPLSGSGVVQFLFCLAWSSVILCTRSGYECCRAVLLLTLCSSFLSRRWDRLMNSGLKISKASWKGDQHMNNKMCWVKKHCTIVS